MVGDKIRFRFAKAGDLRLLSHLDLARCVERMLRRADVPFKMTQGFHPAPRVVFALSLPLGVLGLNEVVEIELAEPRDEADLLGALNAQAPRGLEFASTRAIPMKSSAVARRMTYTLALTPAQAEAVRPLAAELMAAEKVWVDRYKPTPRRLNIRPYLRNLAATETSLELDLWVTSTGTARADELLRLLNLAEELTAGGLSRSHLELHDETPPGQPDAPPSGPAETAYLDPSPAALADEHALPIPAFDEPVVE